MKRILLSIVCCSPLFFTSNLSYALDATNANNSLRTPIEQYGPIKSSETLWAVSSKLRPDTSVSVQQTLLAIYKLNPGVFKKGNINQFKPQSIIDVPSLAFIQQQTNQEALNLINGYAPKNKKKSAAQIQKQVNLVEQSLKIEPLQLQGQITITELNNIAEQARLSALEKIEEQSQLAELEQIEEQSRLAALAKIEAQAQIKQQEQQALFAEYQANKQTLSVTQENLLSLQDELSLVNQQLITVTETNQAMQLKIAPFISEITDLKVQIENDTRTNEKLIEIIEQYKVQFSENVSSSSSNRDEVNSLLGWVSSSVTNLLLVLISPLLLLSLLFLILLRRNTNKEDDEQYQDESSVQFNRSTFFNMDELQIDKNATHDQQGDLPGKIKQKEKLDDTTGSETNIKNVSTQIDFAAKKSPINVSEINSLEEKRSANEFSAELLADIEDLQLAEKQACEENEAIQINTHSEHFTDEQLADLSVNIKPDETITEIEDLQFAAKQACDENEAIPIDAHSEHITEETITANEDLQFVQEEVSNDNKVLQNDTDSENKRILLELSNITQLQQKQLEAEQKTNNELYIESINNTDEGQVEDVITEQVVIQSDQNNPFMEDQAKDQDTADNTSYFELISDIQHLSSVENKDSQQPLSETGLVSQNECHIELIDDIEDLTFPKDVDSTESESTQITAKNERVLFELSDITQLQAEQSETDLQAKNELFIELIDDIDDFKADKNVTNLFKNVKHDTKKDQSTANESANKTESLKIDTNSDKDSILLDFSDVATLQELQAETTQLSQNKSLIKSIDNIEDLQLDKSSINKQELELIENIEDLHVDISLTNNDDVFDPNSLDYLTEELSNSTKSSIDVDKQQLHQQGTDFISIEKLLEDDQTVDGDEPYSEFDINLGLDAFPDMLNHSENIDIDDDQHGIAAQLDLARAYLEIDDKSNAKKILISAVEHSNGEQRNEIDNLLTRLK